MLLDWCTGLLKPQRDVVEVVPSEAMTDSFRAYITASNDFLGRRQIASLKKLHNFIKVTTTARECSAPRTESHDQSLQPLLHSSHAGWLSQDTSLPGEDQAAIRLRAIAAWGVPNIGVMQPEPFRPAEFFEKHVLPFGNLDLSLTPKPLSRRYIAGWSLRANPHPRFRCDHLWRPGLPKCLWWRETFPAPRSRLDWHHGMPPPTSVLPLSVLLHPPTITLSSTLPLARADTRVAAPPTHRRTWCILAKTRGLGICALPYTKRRQYRPGLSPRRGFRVQS